MPDVDLPVRFEPDAVSELRSGEIASDAAAVAAPVRNLRRSIDGTFMAVLMTSLVLQSSQNVVLLSSHL